MEVTEDQLVSLVWKIIRESGSGGISESKLREKVKGSGQKVRKSLFAKVLIRMEYYVIRTKKGERWFVDLSS